MSTVESLTVRSAPRARSIRPELAVGLVVLLVGLGALASRWQLVQDRGLPVAPMIAATLAVAVAAALARRAPAVALLLVALAVAHQLWSLAGPLPGLALAVAVVVPATALRGQAPTAVAGLVAVPVVADLVLLTPVLPTWSVAEVVLGAALLGVLWVAGLGVRLARRHAAR